MFNHLRHYTDFHGDTHKERLVRIYSSCLSILTYTFSLMFIQNPENLQPPFPAYLSKAAAPSTPAIKRAPRPGHQTARRSCLNQKKRPHRRPFGDASKETSSDAQRLHLLLGISRPRRDADGKRLLERCTIRIGQLHVRRSDVLLEVLTPLRTGNGNDVGPTPE